MTCGNGMPVLFEQSQEEKIEVMRWIAGEGKITRAVHKTIQRNGLTFGAALITRHTLGSGDVRRN